jgi:hypothetical protein
VAIEAEAGRHSHGARTVAREGPLTAPP